MVERIWLGAALLVSIVSGARAHAQACPNGGTRDVVSKECVQRKPGCRATEELAGSVCRPRCTLGSNERRDLKTPPYPCVCESGFERVGSRCEPACPVKRDSYGQCLCALGAELVLVNNARRCLAKCTAGTERVGDKCIAVCGPNQVRSVGDRCFNKCREDQSLQASGKCACRSAPGGLVEVNGKCDCTGNSVLVTYSGGAVQKCEACTGGWKKQGNECVASEGLPGTVTAYEADGRKLIKVVGCSCTLDSKGKITSCDYGNCISDAMSVVCKVRGGRSATGSSAVLWRADQAKPKAVTRIFCR